MNNEQLLAEDFIGYDYVMLGDIHKYQYMNDEKTIAYAGSLIQQSYGETLNKHGVLKWDLTDKKSEYLEVKNDYGFCTIKIIDGKMIETDIPKKPRIRFILENTNQIEYQEVVKELEKKYLIQEIVKESNFKTKAHNNSPTQKTIKNKTSAYTTQEVIIRKHLEKKQLDDVSIKNITELHKKIYQKILSRKKDQVADVMHNAIKNQKWKLLELNFSNTLSYGKDNVIDFRKYDANKIIGIVAPNHYGKSAILDIILFCLFDKCSRGERRDILNKNENSMYCSLLLSIGSQEYLIERLGYRNKNGLTVKIDVNFYIMEKDKKGKIIKKNLNGLDKNDTNKKISELIGDYNDYLTTCFCLQQGKSLNFADMTQLQKKEYLNEILKLNVFQDCHDYARDKLKELTGKLKLLEQKVGQKSLQEMKENIGLLSKDINNLVLQKNNIQQNLITLIDLCLEQNIKPSLTIYGELSHYDLTNRENIIQIQQKLKKIINNTFDVDIDILNKTLIENQNKLNELDDKNITESQNKMHELIAKKEDLLKNIITIPDDFNKEQIKDLIDQKIELNNKISTINKVLENHKDKHLSDKMSRIDELKILISNFRKSLKVVSNNPLDELEKENEKISIKSKELDKVTEFIIDNKLDKYNKRELEIISDQKNNFIKLLQKLGEFKSYETGLSQKNDDIVKKFNKNINKIINKYTNWIQDTKVYLESPESIQPDIINIKREYHDSRQNILDKSINLFNFYHNKDIMNKIDIAQRELDTLSEFSGTKHEVDNLIREKNIYLENIKMIDKNIELHQQYIINYENNTSNQMVIDTINKEIESLKNNCDEHQKKISDIKKKISEAKNILSNNQEKINLKNRAMIEYQFLKKYMLDFLSYELKNEIIDKWSEKKTRLQKNIDELNREIDKKQAEIDIYKREIEQYLLHRKEYDEISLESNLFQLYVQIMNYNGLPYEMLKTYLPMIESDVNQILHSMVNFSIEFTYYDEEKIKDQKIKQLKSNMGSIDVNICYHDVKPYNVQLASGFERFIIGLAIRMTLCQISLTSKPNFLIIDEGWSCLDSENLNNVGAIMNYIKTQYEHVIIISHLEELKNQADYVINIDKMDNYSYIRDNQKLSKKTKN
ncbi:putative hydrolase [Megavirus courdo11]|uniref:Putative hydrolase n=1 Tax=Megavirus courdo11 TaxID=1128140 RepID=K7YHG6_9VIRU|nr:putative hydrolase [Megavirus courdo11]